MTPETKKMDSEHNTSDTAHDTGSVFLIQAEVTQWPRGHGETDVHTKEQGSEVDHATEISGLQNSSHVWESIIWLVFLLIREFAHTWGILQEREGF